MQIFSTIFRYRDPKSPDKLGLYPEKYHIKAFPERRYLWTSRVLVVMAAINICVTIILSMTIFLILPQRGAKPVLYQIHNDNLRKVQPLNITNYDMQLLTESLIREYITARHSFPKSSIGSSLYWNENSLFYAYSDIKTYKDFMQKINLDEIKKYLKKGIRRSIEVDEVENVFGNFYIAYFRTITTSPKSKNPRISLWRAYLRVGFVSWNKDNPPKEYWLNPYGFKVFAYDFGYIDILKNPQ